MSKPLSQMTADELNALMGVTAEELEAECAEYENGTWELDLTDSIIIRNS